MIGAVGSFWFEKYQLVQNIDYLTHIKTAKKIMQISLNILTLICFVPFTLVLGLVSDLTCNIPFCIRESGFVLGTLMGGFGTLLALIWKVYHALEIFYISFIILYYQENSSLLKGFSSAFCATSLVLIPSMAWEDADSYQEAVYVAYGIKLDNL